MSNYGLVNTIQPPSLAKATQPELIRFETNYSAYVQRVEEINASRPANQRIKAATIRQCITPKLVHSLCILGRIEGACKAEEATDEAVKSWFESRLAHSSRDLNDRVEEAISRVTYTLTPRDPAGTAEQFVLDVITALDEHNASEVITETDRCKQLVTKLVYKVEPPELKQLLKDQMGMWTAEQKGNLTFFANTLSTLADQVHAVQTATFKLKRKQSSSQHRNANNKSNQEPPTKAAKTGRTVRERLGRREEEPSHAKRGEKWNKPCLNKEECDGIHPISKCPVTSKEKRRELLDELFGNKKQRGKSAKISSVRSTPRTIPNEEEGRYAIMLNGIEEVGLGDSGADFSTISSNVLAAIREKHPETPYQRLASPMVLEPAVKGNNETCTSTAIAKTQLCLTIILPNTGLPVRIRDVEFLVADEDMAEVLLGRPLLKAIGFDFGKHLQQVGATISGMSEKELMEKTARLSATAFRGLSYQEADDDPVELPECLHAGFGIDSDESIQKAIDQAVKEAASNGMSREGVQSLRKLLQEHRDCLGIKLGVHPPAKVRPLSVKLKPNAKPFRCAQRRYAPNQRKFIRHTVQQLEKIGAVYKNPTARWASPALAVPKPGSEKLRFTVDLRGTNARTLPLQSAMPHLESLLQNCSESECFANIDFTHGYWQIPLDQASQEIMSIQTPDGVYSPTRMLQGGTDSGNHFQSVTSEHFAQKVKRMLQWLDDFLMYAKTEKELLSDIEMFLIVCKNIGFKVNPAKSCFFCNEVKFCGRIISREGVRFHPRNLEALLTMRMPQMGGELQQLMCATNWMRTSIPNYSQTVQPLHDLLELAYKKAGKRTKKSVEKVRVSDSWGTTHTDAFNRIISQLAAATKLSLPKEGYRTCLFTDASDEHWAAILTQSPEAEDHIPVHTQTHEPLCFLSGAFRGSAERWSVPEKEGYAIVEAMCRMDYLTAGRETSIYTDHANLVYIYDPYGQNPGVARHTANKLMRWALKLSAFRYVIEHVPGEKNVWADMLTRWAVEPKKTVHPSNVGRISALMVAPINPGLNEAFDWPSRQEISVSQHNHAAEAPRSLSKKKKPWELKSGQVWIPQSDNQLRLRLLIAAHTGRGGHRASQTTLESLLEHFWWKDLRQDTQQFVRSCFHCIATEPGCTVPRPLGHTMHASKPNEIIHFDYCYMKKGEGDLVYVLIVKDDLSGYVWLKPTAEADAEATATILLNWFASFGVSKCWISDKGSHFKNKLVERISDALKAKHHFTLPYCPWSNGSVEVVCRELLRMSRAILSEFQLPQTAWPSVITLIQSALNNSPTRRLNGKCPLTVFTGLPRDSPLSAIIKNHNFRKVECVKTETVKALGNIEKFHDSLSKIHRECADRSKRQRKNAVDSHNRRTGVRPINFCEGDYVLRGVLQKHAGSKMNLKWLGPSRVTNCRDNYVFEVENLLNGNKEWVHGRRLKFFRNKDFEVTQEIKDHLAYQANELLTIEEFRDIRRLSGRIQLLVKWNGFSDEETDWVSFDSLEQDVPVLLKEYIEDLRTSGTQRQRRIARDIDLQ